MLYTCFSPEWFRGLDSFVVVALAIISVLISIAGFRAYRVTNLKTLLLLSLAFFFNALSYIITLLYNVFIELSTISPVCSIIAAHLQAFTNNPYVIIHLLTILAYMLLLVYLSLRIHKVRVFFLLYIVSAIALIGTEYIKEMFWVLLAIFLLLINWHFWCNANKARKKPAIIIATAFTLITISWFDGLLLHSWPAAYAIGLILELGGYALLLWHLQIIKNGQKKK